MDEPIKPNDTKARIINAALSVYAQYGAEGSTSRKIAARANVGKSTIYEYFPSKEALYDEALSHLLTGMSDARGILRELAQTDPKAALLAYLRNAEHTALNEPQMLLLTAQFMLRELLSSKTIESAKTQYTQKMTPISDELLDDFCMIITQGIACGVFKPQCGLDETSLALTIGALIREIQAEAFLYEHEALRRKITIIHKTVISLLGIDESSEDHQSEEQK